MNCRCYELGAMNCRAMNCPAMNSCAPEFGISIDLKNGTGGQYLTPVFLLDIRIPLGLLGLRSRILKPDYTTTFTLDIG